MSGLGKITKQYFCSVGQQEDEPTSCEAKGLFIPRTEQESYPKAL